MSKQSTPFQRAVYLIKKRLADEGQVVTESLELHEIVSGAAREVDVVLTTSVAGHDFVVSFECRQRGKKAAKPWVEEMAAKHAGLPTDLLILVSSQGFYEPAKVRARELNIRTLVPAELTAEGVGKIVRTIKNLWIGSLDLSVDAQHIAIRETQHQTFYRGPFDGRWATYNLEGSEVCQIRHLVDSIVESFLYRIDVNSLSSEWKEYECSFEIPPIRDIQEQQMAVIIHYPNPVPHFALVAGIYLAGQVRFSAAKMEMTSGELSGAAFSYGDTTLMGQKASAVITELEGQDAQLEIKLH